MRIGDGPAAVIGDDGCSNATGANAGKAQPFGRSESQKTCLGKQGHGCEENTGPLVIRGKEGHPGSNACDPGFFWGLRLSTSDRQPELADVYCQNKEAEMHFYWRIQQDLGCLGEAIGFIHPGFRRSYLLWVRKNATGIALAEGLTPAALMRPSLN